MTTARKRKRRGTIGPASDAGPLERYQHGDTILVEPGEDAGVVRRRVTTQTTLDRYFQRNQIDQRQYDAGLKLHRLWRAAAATPSVTMRYGPRVPGRSGPGAAADITDRAAAAHGHLNEALRAVGIVLSGVVVHVCMTDGAAADWALAKGLPKPDGIARLRAGLEALADWWRI